MWKVSASCRLRSVQISSGERTSPFIAPPCPSTPSFLANPKSMLCVCTVFDARTMEQCGYLDLAALQTLAHFAVQPSSGLFNWTQQSMCSTIRVVETSWQKVDVPVSTSHMVCISLLVAFLNRPRIAILHRPTGTAFDSNAHIAVVWQLMPWSRSFLYMPTHSGWSQIRSDISWTLPFNSSGILTARPSLKADKDDRTHLIISEYSVALPLHWFAYQSCRIRSGTS
mmetsp:Transcript_22877/g.40913  ORF Transcript_22877/g.40913 Transcript_22877/m.40913 type:complete len:226 (-) Transcript_22877:380-1057(-)